jgi:hypothetical protein
METSREAQFSSEHIPDQQWDEPLDTKFCDIVFGRQLTPKELEEKNRNIAVSNLEMRVAALQREYPDWDVYMYDEGEIKMKVAVAMLQHEDPAKLQVLFLHEDLQD